MARTPKKISAFDVALGGVIRSKRGKKKLSQAALAKKVGLALSNYQRREEGTVEITTSELYRIAAVVDVPAAKLVEEALDDYGGMEKLLEEHTPTSVVADTVLDEDDIEYVGHVKPDYDLAADENERK